MRFAREHSNPWFYITLLYAINSSDFIDTKKERATCLCLSQSKTLLAEASLYYNLHISRNHTFGIFWSENFFRSGYCLTVTCLERMLCRTWGIRIDSGRFCTCLSCHIVYFSMYDRLICFFNVTERIEINLQNDRVVMKFSFYLLKASRFEDLWMP